MIRSTTAQNVSKGKLINQSKNKEMEEDKKEIKQDANKK